MYLLTIVFGPNATAWALLFKTAEEAVRALKKIAEPEESAISIMDDFGQHAFIKASEISGAMLEDLDKSKVAQIERGLHQARTQARAQQQAAADPILKNAANVRGPAMLDPIGNGRFS